MALNQTRTWLIAYDIADPKRLARLHRYITTIAIPVQYSVFVTVASDHRIRCIADDINSRIDQKADDVRIYPLPKQLELHCLGRHYLPTGVLLLNDADHRNSGAVSTSATAATDP